MCFKRIQFIILGTVLFLSACQWHQRFKSEAETPPPRGNQDNQFWQGELNEFYNSVVGTWRGDCENFTRTDLVFSEPKVGKQVELAYGDPLCLGFPTTTKSTDFSYVVYGDGMILKGQEYLKMYWIKFQIDGSSLYRRMIFEKINEIVVDESGGGETSYVREEGP